MTPTSIHRTAATIVVAAAAAIALPASAQAVVTPVVNNATLTVTSNDDADTINIAAAAGKITVGGTPTTLDADGLANVVVNAGGGDDTVNVNLTAAQVGSVTVDGGG